MRQQLSLVLLATGRLEWKTFSWLRQPSSFRNDPTPLRQISEPCSARKKSKTMFLPLRPMPSMPAFIA